VKSPYFWFNTPNKPTNRNPWENRPPSSTGRRPFAPGNPIEFCDDPTDLQRYTNVGVEPKIEGKHPKWMVKIMENPIKMDDLGGKTYYFRKHPMSSRKIG